MIYTLGIDPARSGVHWAWLRRSADGTAKCASPHPDCRQFGSFNEREDSMLPMPCRRTAEERKTKAPFTVGVENFTFIKRGIGEPGIRTCMNIGRVMQELIDNNIDFALISRQSIKGFLGIGRAKQKRTIFSGGGTEIDTANRQAVQMRGIVTAMMTRDHIAAISVALKMEHDLREEKTMEGA